MSPLQEKFKENQTQARHNQIANKIHYRQRK